MPKTGMRLCGPEKKSLTSRLPSISGISWGISLGDMLMKMQSEPRRHRSLLPLFGLAIIVLLVFVGPMSTDISHTGERFWPAMNEFLVGLL